MKRNRGQSWLDSTRRPVVLATALILDLTLGDPPNAFHPVAWMGSFIAAARRRAPRQGPLVQLAYGGLLAFGGLLGMFGLGRTVMHAINCLPTPLEWLVEAVILKMTFSIGRLTKAAQNIEEALEASNLPEARRLVSWHLVSRDTSRLKSSQVAAASIESVAESASDGIMAPLLAHALAGLPGALAYRFANTADSMLGYRDPAREWLGKAPARLDDLLNLVPARVTALLLALGSALAGERAQNAWHIWQRDRGKTASPNAGHPMSVMAGALGVELEKTGHYVLGEGQRRPSLADIGRALRVLHAGMALGTALLIGLSIATRNRRSDRRVTD